MIKTTYLNVDLLELVDAMNQLCAQTLEPIGSKSIGFFCHECDSCDTLPPDMRARVKINSARYTCKGSHKSRMFPTTKIKCLFVTKLGNHSREVEKMLNVLNNNDKLLEHPNEDGFPILEVRSNVNSEEKCGEKLHVISKERSPRKHDK